MKLCPRLPLLSAALLTIPLCTHAAEIDWEAVNEETLAHFQAMVRIDTADPPGREIDLSNYLLSVLQAEGIDYEVFALEDNRPNIVARLKGNGGGKPLLMMAHQDTVNVDASKWSFPPHSATRDGGWIYGRGTVDDKDNLVAALMTLVMLKRQNVPLERDVILLAESGEEGSTQIGIQYMVDNHLDAIEAEFCLAEGGSVVRQNGEVFYASVQTVEKLPRAISLASHGVAGHGSVPLQGNAIVALSRAVATIADWQPPIQLSDTTTAYFSKLASISEPEAAARYRAVLNPNSPAGREAVNYLKQYEPRNAAVLFSTISPTIVDGGYRVNVIPSEGTATLDVRLLPEEDAPQFLEMVREVINNPAVNVEWAARNQRPGASSSLDTDAYRTIESVFGQLYGAPVLPVMSTGATDMAYLRARGIQCYGIGPAIDAEDGPLGFGAHSDQERIIESELYRFVQAHYQVVEQLVAQ
ncbi:MAG: M20/M25/M40 family metallo-hydrolase [Gammaproteobacteria bacterium]|nr:M20/M25/M40 family metallo-hydrolase [Pseudomonadales bacterium]